jgi:hypothetical protein
MIIFPTKVAISLSLLTFRFWSFVTIRSESCVSGFGTLVLLLVVVRMLLLGVFGFIFLLRHKGFGGGTCSVDQCCICRVGESVGEGLDCNFSTTSVETIGISWKMSQDLKKIQKHSFFSKF